MRKTAVNGANVRIQAFNHATTWCATLELRSRSEKELSNIVLPDIGAADIAKRDVVRAMTGLRHDVFEVGPGEGG